MAYARLDVRVLAELVPADQPDASGSEPPRRRAPRAASAAPALDHARAAHEPGVEPGAADGIQMPAAGVHGRPIAAACGVIGVGVAG